METIHEIYEELRKKELINQIDNLSMVSLADYSTKELVEELKRRGGFRHSYEEDGDFTCFIIPGKL